MVSFEMRYRDKSILLKYQIFSQIVFPSDIIILRIGVNHEKAMVAKFFMQNRSAQIYSFLKKISQKYKLLSRLYVFF